MTPPLDDAHAPRSLPEALVGLGRRCYLAAVLLTIMSLGSLFMLAVALVTLFRARRFCTEVLARAMARAALGLCGVRVVVEGEKTWPESQTIYIFNHTSSLDLYILIALGLPNTRFFLKGYLRRVLPLGLMGYLTGTFWTVPQSLPQQRVRLFQAADCVLRRKAICQLRKRERGVRPQGL
jgi:1-acyl-sn-glycerol-3-phosphate acyltransferase